MMMKQLSSYNISNNNNKITASRRHLHAFGEMQISKTATENSYLYILL